MGLMAPTALTGTEDNMPVSSDIYGAVQAPKQYDPLNAMARMLQVKGLQQQQEMGAMQADEYRRGVDRTNRLQSVLAGDATPESLRKAGFLKESMDLEKNSAEVTHKKSETTKNSAEVAAKKISLYRDAVNGVNDPASAVAYIQAMHADPDLKGSAITAVPIEKLIAQVPQDPAQFGEFKRRFTLGAEKFMADERQRLAQVETNRHNTSTETNTVRGQDLTASTARRGQDISASTTRRGQDMVDQRSRESTTATLTKPFEITGEDGKPVLVQQDKQGNIKPVQGYTPKQGASKPLTDTQAKALQFGSRMQAAEDIFGTLAEKGVTTSVPGSRAGYGVGAVVSALQPAERQQLDQAKRDFINAVLRRESGAAIAASEFDSAEKQYFPQPGEDATVKAQKKKNRELAARGILAEVPDADNRVAKVRGGATASDPSNDPLGLRK